MKKILGLFLSLVMVCSLSVTAFAYQTEIAYTGTGTEAYELTVPATLAPGASGEVQLEGTWASNRTVKVTADSSVTLTNSIDSSTKTLDIDFDGINQAGDNTKSISVSEGISVADIENALFGVWSGEFYYNLSVEGGSSTPSVEYAATFADNSWSEIIDAVQNDAVPSTWSVGDTKPMTINSVDYNVQIIGKDHDTYTSGGTAPLTFQLVEIYTEARMNATNDNTTGWLGSEMRTTTLSTVLSAMPSEVQSAIKAVDKQTLKGDKSGLETTSDKLFLLSEVEVLGSTTYSNGYSEGSRYAYYANGGSAVKTHNGSADWWWLRGPNNIGSSNFNYVGSIGNLGNYIASSTIGGVAFGFCF